MCPNKRRMSRSKIEWTDKTWNPVTGCTKVSEACQNCFAEVMARRLSGMPASKDKYSQRFALTLHPEALGEPYHWTTSHTVFVCSMGDLFHENVPMSFQSDVMEVISNCPHHIFQILTKRPQNMLRFFNVFEVPKNAWLGVTCENAAHYDRIDVLRQIKDAPVRFISAEPLLGDMSDIDLSGIDWVIAGGEVSPRARRTDPDCFRSLRDRCTTAGVPFFFKAWGTYGEDGVKRSKNANGHLLDGLVWRELPTRK